MKESFELNHENKAEFVANPEVLKAAEEGNEFAQLIQDIPGGTNPEFLQLIYDYRPVAEMRTKPEFQKQMVEKLKEQGLFIGEHQFDRSKFRSFFVAKKPELIDEVLSSVSKHSVADHKRFGELMGFPKTAVDAFVNKDEMVPNEEEDEILGFENIFFTFRLSRAHMQEELEYLRENYKLLLEKAPFLIDNLLVDSEEYKEQVRNFVYGKK